MAPTLRHGELVLVNRRAYRQRVPRRGELVAARPSACAGRAVVKRIAGTPADDVAIEGRSWHLGEDEFFLLGDRAEESRDSRRFGPVSRRELIGRVGLRLWPWRVF